MTGAAPQSRNVRSGLSMAVHVLQYERDEIFRLEEPVPKVVALSLGHDQLARAA